MIAGRALTLEAPLAARRLLQGQSFSHADSGRTMEGDFTNVKSKTVHAPIALCGLVFWKPRRIRAGSVSCVTCLELIALDNKRR